MSGPHCSCTMQPKQHYCFTNLLTTWSASVLTVVKYIPGVNDVISTDTDTFLPPLTERRATSRPDMSVTEMVICPEPMLAASIFSTSVAGLGCILTSGAAEKPGTEAST